MHIATVHASCDGTIDKVFMSLGDIYFSYARSDDPAVQGNVSVRGMVASLHAGLLAQFEDFDQARPTIFRDTQQTVGIDQFEARLGQALGAAKLFFILLSRGWLDSSWCKRELDFFLARWRQRGENEQDIKRRIFVARRHSVASEDQPAALRDVRSYDLMLVSPQSSEEFEYFDVSLDRPRDERWFTCVRSLARDLCAQFRGQDVQTDAPESSPTRAHQCMVYVARPAVDMEQSCARLVEELYRRGYRVVPDPGTPLPRPGSEAVKAIDAALDGSAVCVHLLGDPRGSQSDAAESIAQLQLERSAAKALASPTQGLTQPRDFHRLIWAPRSLPRSPDNVPPRDPLAVLASHTHLTDVAMPSAGFCRGDKLDGGTLTKFSQFVLQHLEEVFGPVPARTRVEPGAQIYVQHDEGDAVIARQVADSLKRVGFAPVLSPHEGDAQERGQLHRDHLYSSEAVFLCWAYASPVWVRAAASELGRWQELGRSEAFTTRTIVALAPSSEHKERLCRLGLGPDIDKIIDVTSAPPVKPYALELFLQQLADTAP